MPQINEPSFSLVSSPTMQLNPLTHTDGYLLPFTISEASDVDFHVYSTNTNKRVDPAGLFTTSIRLARSQSYIGLGWNNSVVTFTATSPDTNSLDAIKTGHFIYVVRKTADEFTSTMTLNAYNTAVVQAQLEKTQRQMQELRDTIDNQCIKVALGNRSQGPLNNLEIPKVLDGDGPYTFQLAANDADGEAELTLLSYRYRGQWDATVQYYKGDEVLRVAHRYLALRDNIGQDPVTSLSDWSSSIPSSGQVANVYEAHDLAQLTGYVNQLNESGESDLHDNPIIVIMENIIDMNTLTITRPVRLNCSPGKYLRFNHPAHFLNISSPLFFSDYLYVKGAPGRQPETPIIQVGDDTHGAISVLRIEGAPQGIYRSANPNFKSYDVAVLKGYGST